MDDVDEDEDAEEEEEEEETQSAQYPTAIPSRLGSEVPPSPLRLLQRRNQVYAHASGESIPLHCIIQLIDHVIAYESHTRVARIWMSRRSESQRIHARPPIRPVSCGFGREFRELSFWCVHLLHIPTIFFTSVTEYRTFNSPVDCLCGVSR